MIVLKGYKVLYDASNNPGMYDRRTIAKWQLKEVEKFSFDITSAKEWKKFLQEYRTPDGKLLPITSPAGDVIVYSVFSQGMLPAAYEGVFPSRRGVNLFPGFKKNGERRNPAIYGRIR